MFKKIAFAGLGLVLLASPVLASADVLSDLRAQLEGLLSQLSQLQSQLSAVATTATPRPSCTLRASPSTVQSGRGSRISWTTRNATWGTINQGIGSMTPIASSSRAISAGITQTTAYTATIRGLGGSATCSTTVTVTSGGTSPSITITSPNGGQTFNLGNLLTIRWVARNLPVRNQICTYLVDSAAHQFAFPAEGACRTDEAPGALAVSGTLVRRAGYDLAPGAYRIFARILGADPGNGRDRPVLAEDQEPIGITVASTTSNLTLTASPTSGSVPLAVHFSARNMPDASRWNYSVDYKDGHAEQLDSHGATGTFSADTNHTYTAAGTYLAVLNRCWTGCQTLGTTTITVTSSSSGTIVVAPGQQPANSLAPQGTIIPFTTITLTNTGNANLNVSGINVQRVGLASDAVFRGLRILQGTDVIGITDDGVFSSDHRKTIPVGFTLVPGQSRTVTIAGDMVLNLSAYAGQTVGLTVEGIVTTATVNGLLPIAGATQTVNATLDACSHPEIYGYTCWTTPVGITVTSPNGGEVWSATPSLTDTISGFEQYKKDITWAGVPDSGGYDGRVTAYLEKYVNGQYVTVGRIPAFAYGSIAWVVGIVNPNINCGTNTSCLYGTIIVPAGQYYVRLTDTQTGTSDRSDAPFTISNNQSTTFSATPTSGLAPLSLWFTMGGLNLSGPATEYRLYYGDGAPQYHSTWSVGRDSASYTYSRPGTYTAHLNKVTGPSSETEVGTATITVTGSQSTFRSYPIVAKLAIPSAVLVNDNNRDLLRFSISANSSGSIGLGMFRVVTVTNNATVGPLRVYAFTDSGFSNPVSQFTGGLLGTVSNNGNITLANPLEIPAGTTYYFTVIGAVSNVQSSSYLIVTMPGDATFAPLATFASLPYNQFVWSPNTHGTSIYSDPDWTDGYNIAGLPVNGISQRLDAVATQQSTFTASPTSGPAPLAVNFRTSLSASNANIGTYNISYGDGSSTPNVACPNRASNPPTCITTTRHTYSSAGTYTATLIRKAPAGQRRPDIIVGTATITVTGSSTASVRITAPNGGEVFRAGQVAAIRWQTNNLPQNVDTLLAIMDDRIPDWQTHSIFGSSPVLQYARLVSSNGTENVYEYLYTVPSTFNASLPPQYQNIYGGNHYKANVVVLTGGVAGTASQQTVKDLSDGTFTITSTSTLPNPTFTASPTSGAAPLTTRFTANGIGAGDSYYVIFGDTISGPLNMSLLGNGQGTVSHSYTSAGSYTAQLVRTFPCSATGVGPCIPAQIVGTATITVSGVVNTDLQAQINALSAQISALCPGIAVPPPLLGDNLQGRVNQLLVYLRGLQLNGCPQTGAPTLTLTATPASIQSGQSSTLTWSSANAASCVSSGSTIPSDIRLSGSVSVSPVLSAVYTLRCTGAGGSVTKSVTVNVAGSFANCTLDGVTVLHVSSRAFFSARTVPFGSTCASVSQTRTCTNGTLSGTYQYASCTVGLPPALPSVTITASDSSASEAGLATGSYLIRRTGPTTQSLGVSVAVSGTATRDTDYILTQSGMGSGTRQIAIIPIGSATTNVLLTPKQDTRDEPVETVVLTLVDGANYNLGTPISATVRIADNDTVSLNDDDVRTNLASALTALESALQALIGLLGQAQ
ncbi:MAG: hypothetical protein Q7S50_03370 [bacterium]|nr:hypothetical protein [bacterium]